MGRSKKIAMCAALSAPALWNAALTQILATRSDAPRLTHRSRADLRCDRCSTTIRDSNQRSTAFAPCDGDNPLATRAVSTCGAFCPQRIAASAYVKAHAGTPSGPEGSRGSSLAGGMDAMAFSQVVATTVGATFILPFG